MKINRPDLDQRPRMGKILWILLAVAAGVALFFTLNSFSRHTEYISMAVLQATVPPHIAQASSASPSQPNPQAAWIIQMIDSSKLREAVFRRLQATTPELKPTSVEIALQRATQPADAWNIFVMGPEAGFTRSYLEATLDELVKMHLNNPGPGDLRIIERPSPAILRE